MPVLKGAFLKFEGGLLGLPTIVVFQFNPETVSRTPTLNTEMAGGERGDPLRVVAVPSESFSFTLRLDATDQLAAKNPIAVANGILPALSALELLMYPVQKSVELDVPGSESAYVYPPNLLPIVLFFWGPFRIMPVNVTSLSINETEYDPALNPTRAEVSVSLQVIAPPALSRAPKELQKVLENAYTYTQTVKQAMAALNLANALELVGSGTISL